MVQQLWAPWRGTYIEQGPVDQCAMCIRQQEGDEEAFLVHRGSDCFAIMNLYPYNTGHVMVVPNRHVADLDELTGGEQAQSQELIVRTIRALRETYGPHGFNVGLNLGSAAGAGIASHLHWHVVPRWAGDTNFMPVLNATKVVNTHLHESWRRIRDAFEQTEGT